MAVQMLDPSPPSRVLDPACGTGGFLITAMNLMLQKIDRYKRSTWTDPTHPTELELDELYRARRELLSNSVVGFDLNPSSKNEHGDEQ
jgi:type I restriction enzyme M protein